MKAIIWDEARRQQFDYTDIPAELVATAEEWHQMVEATAEANEDLMNKVPGRKTERGRHPFRPAPAHAGLRIQPMLCGTAFKNKGCTHARRGHPVDCRRRRSIRRSPAWMTTMKEVFRYADDDEKFCAGLQAG